MEAKLVSKYYSGGGIDEPVCFVLRYGEKRVLMAFEKPFVFHATGSMVGIPFTGMNTIVERTMEQLIEANVRRVAMRMAETDYITAVSGSAVISMEELEETYKKEPPRYSLLLETEKGSFSFAMD